MGPADLVQILRFLPAASHPDLLAGPGADAAVFRLDAERALVFTADFITPVVNDPHAFGQVAAANALSDVYAVGGEPVLALNLVGFPLRSLPLGMLEATLSGGAGKVAEAGAVVAGGHTIDDAVPKYGLAVVGFAHPEKLAGKSGARPGDALILTKPLGTGVIATAIDRGAAPPGAEEEVVALMATLNRDASRVMVAHGIRACTDVTGFGLLGHLHEMARQSGVAAAVRAGAVPVLPAAVELVRAGDAGQVVSGGTRNNLRYLEAWVDWEAGITEADRIMLCDAQTSGGLLMAVPAGRSEAVLADLRGAGCRAAEIGCLAAGAVGRVRVTP